MKRLLLLICLAPFITEAQIDSSFNLSLELGKMMELEQLYSENKDVAIANELIIQYRTILGKYKDTSDYIALSICRVLVDVHKYDEAIALCDSINEKYNLLFKDRLCLMKASYEKDTGSFILYLSNIIKYLDDYTSKHIELVDTLMQIPIDLGFTRSIDSYVYQMFRLKFCYLSVVNGFIDTFWQLIDQAKAKDWNIDQLNWLLKYIHQFDYMSFTWW